MSANAMVMVGRRAPFEVVAFCANGRFPTARPKTHVGLFETSKDVDNCASRVAGVVDGLDADLVRYLGDKYGDSVFIGPTLFSWTDIKNAAPKSFSKDQAFFNSWKAFKREFDGWKDGWDATTISVLSADAYRECEKYDLEAKDWYDRFVAYGIKPTGPKTTTPSGIPGIIPSTPPSGVSSIPWTPILWVGGLLAVAIILGNIAKFGGGS